MIESQKYRAGRAVKKPYPFPETGIIIFWPPPRCLSNIISTEGRHRLVQYFTMIIVRYFNFFFFFSSLFLAITPVGTKNVIVTFEVEKKLSLPPFFFFFKHIVRQLLQPHFPTVLFFFFFFPRLRKQLSLKSNAQTWTLYSNQGF